MKAIVQDRYGSPGDVLELEEIGKPTVQDDEVLVRVHAATVNWAHGVMVGRGFGLLGHTASACLGDHRVELVCVKEDGAALTPPLLAVHASGPDLEDTMAVDSQPTDRIVDEAHDAPTPRAVAAPGRGSRRQR